MSFVAVAIGGASLLGAGISAGASLSAAGTQADATKSAAQLQADEAQKSLDFQKQEWQTQQTNEAPFLKAGQGAVLQLQDLLAPGGDLTQPWTQQFTPPTIQQAENEPGYKFQEQQGEQALQNAASAQGELLDPNAARAETQYAQTSAQNDYQQVYNNAFQQYQQNYNQFQVNQANKFNRLASLAGVGQTTAAQLGQTGQQASNNVGNIMLTSGAQQGADINAGAAATASGYVGAGNAISGALNNVGSTLMLQSLLNPSSTNPGLFTDPGVNVGTPSYMPGGVASIPPYDPATGLPAGSAAPLELGG